MVSATPWGLPLPQLQCGVPAPPHSPLRLFCLMVLAESWMEFSLAYSCGKTSSCTCPSVFNTVTSSTAGESRDKGTRVLSHICSPAARHIHCTHTHPSCTRIHSAHVSVPHMHRSSTHIRPAHASHMHLSCTCISRTRIHPAHASVRTRIRAAHASILHMHCSRSPPARIARASVLSRGGAGSEKHQLLQPTCVRVW